MIERYAGHLKDIKKFEKESPSTGGANFCRTPPLTGDASTMIMDHTRGSHLSTEDNSVITMKLRWRFREYRG